jgi:hypothetical protein
MLDCLKIRLAELAKRHSTFRSIDLQLIIAQLAKVAPSDRGVRCFQATADFLAGRFDARIVNAV